MCLIFPDTLIIEFVKMVKECEKKVFEKKEQYEAVKREEMNKFILSFFKNPFFEILFW